MLNYISHLGFQVFVEEHSSHLFDESVISISKIVKLHPKNNPANFDFKECNGFREE